MSPLAANTSHRNSTKKLRSLFWTTMFWHEIIQANVSIMNVQIILSEHFHFYKLISRWVPEMMVQILTTFVHKFSGFVHPTFKQVFTCYGWGGHAELQNGSRLS